MRTRVTVAIAVVIALAGCQAEPSRAPVARPPISGTEAPEHVGIPHHPMPAPAAAPVPAAPGLDVFQLAATSAFEAWAATNRGLLHTVDAGRSWIDATPPGFAQDSPSISRSVTASAGVVWFVAGYSNYPATPVDSHAQVFRSIDGGRHWTTSGAFPGLGGGVAPYGAAVAWLVVGQGIAAGSSGLDLYRTVNGTDWRLVASAKPELPAGTIPFGGHKGPFTLVSDSEGWFGMTCTCSGAAVYSTFDGGQSWQRHDLPATPVLSDASDAQSQPIFFGGGQGVVATHVTRPSAGELVLYTTTDSGQTWRVASSIPSGSDPQIVNTSTWWVRTPAALGHTVDGGRTWTWSGKVPGETGRFQFVDSLHGWSLDQYPASIAVTSDGGWTWTSRPIRDPSVGG